MWMLGRYWNCHVKLAKWVNQEKKRVCIIFLLPTPPPTRLCTTLSVACTIITRFFVYLDSDLYFSPSWRLWPRTLTPKHIMNLSPLKCYNIELIMYNNNNIFVSPLYQPVNYYYYFFVLYVSFFKIRLI